MDCISNITTLTLVIYAAASQPETLLLCSIKKRFSWFFEKSHNFARRKVSAVESRKYASRVFSQRAESKPWQLKKASIATLLLEYCI